MVRPPRADPLRGEKRQRIHECIAANPGIHFQGVCRATGIASGTVRHHLNVLRNAGLLTERAHGHTRRFFPAGSDSDWQRTVMLREPGLRVLHGWLAYNPSAVQLAVLNAMREHAWSRSTTQHRLKRLADAGLVQVLLSGRYKRYTLRAATILAVTPALAVPA